MLSLPPLGYFLCNCQSVKVSSVKIEIVKLSRQSADKNENHIDKVSTVKRQTVKLSSVKRESVKCQKNGFDSLTVGGAGRRGKKASRYVVFSEYIILFQRQLSKCQRVSKWGFDSKL